MTKRLILAAAALLFLCSAPASAQSRIRILTDENNRLQAKVDSLQTIIDSLQYKISLFPEFETAAEEYAEQELSDTTATFDHARADSLLALWYESNRAQDLLAPSEIDSVRFSSNVSDSVMMRRLGDMNPYFTLPFNSTVKNYMVLYSEKMPTAMGRILGLGNYYFPIFEEALNRYNLPLELKYLSVVESMLSPTATSRVGAKGQWQFMYRTAKGYGMRIDSFVDERMNVEKAVDAAARYLRDAYRVFGDWSLAISSYNCGAGNVNKAIKRAGSRDFWKVYEYLPRETRGYMPAFVGVMYALTYCNEYGLRPSEVGLPAQIDTFEIKSNLHFKQIQEVVGIPLDELRSLNPEYYQDIIPGSGGVCSVRIPFRWTSAFMSADQDSLYKHNAAQYISEQVLKGIEDGANPSKRIAYKVKSGDYLGRIATKYHVTVNQIMKWNHMRNTNVRVGQTIYLYPGGGAPVASSSAKSGSASKPASPSKSGSSKPASSYKTYTVKSGDSLWAIARNNGVTVQEIMDCNGLKSNNIQPGKKIRIPVQ